MKWLIFFPQKFLSSISALLVYINQYYLNCPQFFFKLNYLLLSIMIKIKKLLKEKRCLKIRKNKNRWMPKTKLNNQSSIIFLNLYDE